MGPIDQIIYNMLECTSQDSSVSQPMSGYHPPASETPFKWRDGGLLLDVYWSQLASGDTHLRLLISSAYFRICVLTGPSIVGINTLENPVLEQRSHRVLVTANECTE